MGPLLVHLEPAVPEAAPQNFQLCKLIHSSFLVEPVGVALPSFTAKDKTSTYWIKLFRSGTYSLEVHSPQGGYSDPREISLN